MTFALDLGGWGKYKDATIAVAPNPSTVGQTVTFSGSGIPLRDLSQQGDFWLWVRPDLDGNHSVHALPNLDGTFSVDVLLNQEGNAIYDVAGTYEVHLYTVRSPGQFISLASVALTVVP